MQIFNHVTETHRVRDLAKMIAERADVGIDYLPNPRNEADENDLHVKNDRFLNLGLNPTTLDEGLMEEVTDITRRIPCQSPWNAAKRSDAEADAE